MNIQRTGRFANTVAGVFLAIAVVSPLTGFGADRKVSHQASSDGVMAQAKDVFANGWRTGYIKSALLLNGHINPFGIDVKVSGSTAQLTGYVDSAVDKSLAEEITLSVDGIASVDNQLVVDESKTSAGDRKKTVTSQLSDAAITAKVKARMLTNGNVPGMSINVDTNHSVVTLKGSVDSDAVRELAFYIAKNTDGVSDVDNRLTVEPDGND